MSSEIENDLIRMNAQLCDFSINGQFFAIAYQTNLVIKSTKTFDTVYSFTFPNIIEYFEWSKNSEYILCASIKKAVIQVYSVYYPDWKFKLTEGSAGLERVSWSPDSKHILIFSDFNIQISVWSLENQSVTHIQNVKSCFSKLYFSPSGNKLAVVISNKGEDNIEIYRTDTWKLDKKLICSRLSSIDGICWSPNSELLCIWCSFSNEPKLIIYSNKLEKDITVFRPTTISNLPDIKCIYQKELRGIENVTWMSSGQLLAVAGFNEMIVLLNHVTWTPVLQLYLDPVIKENYLNKVYKDRIVQTMSTNKNTSFYDKHILEEKSERPLNIKIGKKSDIGRYSVAKFDILVFSFCGQYLAIKHQLYPTTLWIWNIVEDYLDYLLLENNITAAKWNPSRAHLLIFCEYAHIFEWTPNSAKCIPTPRNITALDTRWHPQGNISLICGYNKAVIYQIENK